MSLECSSCGVLWSAELSSCGVWWSAELSSCGVWKQHLEVRTTLMSCFFSSCRFYGFYLSWLARALAGGSLVFFCVLFFLPIVIPLKNKRWQQLQRLSSSLLLVLAPFRHEDDNAYLSSHFIFSLITLVKNRRWRWSHRLSSSLPPLPCSCSSQTRKWQHKTIVFVLFFFWPLSF